MKLNVERKKKNLTWNKGDIFFYFCQEDFKKTAENNIRIYNEREKK